MGQRCSTNTGKAFVANDYTPGQGVEVTRITKLLKLSSRDVNRLYQYFLKLDALDDGYVSIKRFITQVGGDTNNNFLAELMFRLFDRDSDGHLTFVEFIMACWNYLTFDEETLTILVFELFDWDKSGSLNKAEVTKMLDLIWKDQAGSITKEEAFRLLDSSNDGVVSIIEFSEISKRTKLFLSTVHNMQSLLREKTLGQSNWIRISTDRKLHYGTNSAYKVVEVALPMSSTLGRTIRNRHAVVAGEDKESFPVKYQMFVDRHDYCDRDVSRTFRMQSPKNSTSSRKTKVYSDA